MQTGTVDRTVQTLKDPNWVEFADFERMLDDLNGSTITIEVELELPRTGNMVTVRGVTCIAPAMYCLLLAERAYGSPILPYVVSSYRSIAQQAALYADRENNPLPVAPPGKSNHNNGTALDIVESVANAIDGVMAQFGWVRDVMPEDPVHFHFVGLN